MITVVARTYRETNCGLKCFRSVAVTTQSCICDAPVVGLVRREKRRPASACSLIIKIIHTIIIIYGFRRFT